MSCTTRDADCGSLNSWDLGPSLVSSRLRWPKTSTLDWLVGGWLNRNATDAVKWVSSGPPCDLEAVSFGNYSG